MTGHFCADCRREYLQEELDRNPSGQRKCSACGSKRVDVEVHPPTIVAKAQVGTPSIMITTHLWTTWMGIAIDQAHAALQARQEALNGSSDSWSGHLTQEFNAAIVAVAGSAHALDALYGSAAVPASIRAPFLGKGTKRHGKIREALKAIYNTGPVNTFWNREFEWLFELRDAAAHAEEKPRPPVSHPLGTNTAYEQVAYSAESALRAASFALSVLRRCADFPRPTVSESVAWASAHRRAVDDLEQRWNSQTNTIGVNPTSTS
ncbi:hypothetical protein [Nonomuraea sp. NPDC049141]|uniref:hypothetical protein n=1 Tax=Nonomuraea sp. NPDC049141 TaxID=3155500 RepID=UPI0033F76396